MPIVDTEPYQILVAEDDEPERETLVRLLKSRRYYVESVAFASECLNRLHSERFDIVILDSSLPDMSGLEALRSIRLDRATREIAVILLSLDPTDEQFFFGFHYCADCHLAKPYSRRELLQFLDRLTAGPRDQWDNPRFAESAWERQWDLEAQSMGVSDTGL